MLLKDYLKGLRTTKERARFAASVKSTPGHLRQVAAGYKRCSVYLAMLIDLESGGVVTAEELRPDVDWAYYLRTR